MQWLACLPCLPCPPTPAHPVCLLQCFCGMLARMWQTADLFRDTREQLAAGKADAAALMGDLNTLGNGVARLSPNYCTDHMRWLSLGWYEAEVSMSGMGCKCSPAELSAACWPPRTCVVHVHACMHARQLYL